MNLVLIVHAFSCWFMAGAIWLVQVLVYPNFRLVSQTEFQTFHKFHMERITWVVAPLMGLELISGIWLAIHYQSSLFIGNFVSVLALWGLTGLVNVPSHETLRFEVETTKTKLIRNNWPRTILWTMRSIFLVWMIHLSIEGVLK